MCTMVPMRSVPHRVVCLLGLDDGVFPRQAHGRRRRRARPDPCVGERDAALGGPTALPRRHPGRRGSGWSSLYTGADERTGADRPPAVPLGELLDVLDRPRRGDGRCATGSSSGIRCSRSTPATSCRARSGRRGPFSFDRAAHAGARAAVAARHAPATVPRRAASPRHPGDRSTSTTWCASSSTRSSSSCASGSGSRRPTRRRRPTTPLPGGARRAREVGGRRPAARAPACAASTATDAVRAELLRGELPPGALGDAIVAPIARGRRPAWSR